MGDVRATLVVAPRAPAAGNHKGCPYHPITHIASLPSCLTTCLLCLHIPVLAMESAEEYEIKAVYLFNLGKFFTWPKDRLQEGKPATRLGISPSGYAICWMQTGVNRVTHVCLVIIPKQDVSGLEKFGIDFR